MCQSWRDRADLWKTDPISPVVSTVATPNRPLKTDLTSPAIYLYGSFLISRPQAASEVIAIRERQDAFQGPYAEAWASFHLEEMVAAEAEVAKTRAGAFQDRFVTCTRRRSCRDPNSVAKRKNDRFKTFFRASFHEPDIFSRVGPDQGDPTRSVIYEKLLNRPDPSRETSNTSWSDPTRPTISF